MEVHTNPHGKGPARIKGLRLAPGALIQSTDMYDSTDGTWRPAGPMHDGARIHKGCRTIWVRPDTELSESARDLLIDLARKKLYLHLYDGRWKVIPSPAAKEDGRIDWGVTVQGAAKELVGYGYVTRTETDRDVYEVAPAGHTAAKVPN